MDESTAAALQLLNEAVRGGRHRVDSGNTLDGVFKQLLDPKQFVKMVYPGQEPPTDGSAPTSFQVLLGSGGGEGDSVCLHRAVTGRILFSLFLFLSLSFCGRRCWRTRGFSRTSRGSSPPRSSGRR